MMLMVFLITVDRSKASNSRASPVWCEIAGEDGEIWLSSPSFPDGSILLNGWVSSVF